MSVFMITPFHGKHDTDDYYAYVKDGVVKFSLQRHYDLERLKHAEMEIITKHHEEKLRAILKGGNVRLQYWDCFHNIQCFIRI